MAKNDPINLSDAQAAEERSKGPETPRRGSTHLLLAAGVALLAAGAAIVLLPWLSPDGGWIVRSLARHGITSGPIAVGGLVLLGICDVLRSHRRLPAALAQDAQAPQEDLECIAADLAGARSDIQDLRVELVHVKEAVRAAQEQGSGANANGHQDAIFRLAASLDQLGARLEQRLAAQHVDVQDMLLDLNHIVLSLSSQVSELARDEAVTTSGAQAENRFVPRIELPGEAAAAPSGAMLSDEEIDWRSIEDEGLANLGLLDSLDEFGQPLPEQTSPATGSRAAIREEIGLTAPTQDEPGAPIPRARLVRDDHAPLEIPVEDKLEHLRSLLADPKVREALEAIRRTV